MIFVTVNAETKAVLTAVFNPERLSESDLAKGFLTDKEYPVPEPKPLKNGIVLYNPAADAFSVVYEDRPPTQEEENQQLKTEMKLMQTALDDLIMGGMM